MEGALRLLRFVEMRRPTGRRFGADADARWGDFKGDLETVDRIELLIRDADAEWPGAFGARTTYALRSLAEDEPFGAAWEGIDPIEAEDLWRHVVADAPPADAGDALRAIALTWGIALGAAELGEVSATDRLVVAGPSAIAAAVEAFAGGTDLDWAEQVIVVATPPAHRQLAAAAGALLNTKGPTRLFANDEAAGAKVPVGPRLLVSADADPDDHSAARRLAGG